MQTGLTLVALLLAAPVAAQGLGGYAGQQTREIKALSAQEQTDLLAGRGMGLARAGELNHHPGPAHVLEIQDELSLTSDQIATVQSSVRRMEMAAMAIGAELVTCERELDAQFQQGTITLTRLAELTTSIGSLQGQLRAVHLAAHVEMRTLLSPAQIVVYDRLRGYAGGEVPVPAHSHRMQPG